MSNAVREFLLFAPFEGVPKSITRWMVSRLAEFCVPWGWLKQAASHVYMCPTQKVRWSFCWTTQPQFKLLQSLQNFKKIIWGYHMSIILNKIHTWMLKAASVLYRPTRKHLHRYNLSGQRYWEAPSKHRLPSVNLMKSLDATWYVIMGALSLSDNTGKWRCLGHCVIAYVFGTFRQFIHQLQCLWPFRPASKWTRTLWTSFNEV